MEHCQTLDSSGVAAALQCRTHGDAIWCTSARLICVGHSEVLVRARVSLWLRGEACKVLTCAVCVGAWQHFRHRSMAAFRNSRA